MARKQPWPIRPVSRGNHIHILDRTARLNHRCGARLGRFLHSIRKREERIGKPPRCPAAIFVPWPRRFSRSPRGSSGRRPHQRSRPPSQTQSRWTSRACRLSRRNRKSASSFRSERAWWPPSNSPPAKLPRSGCCTSTPPRMRFNCSSLVPLLKPALRQNQQAQVFLGGENLQRAIPQSPGQRYIPRTTWPLAPRSPRPQW